MVQGKKDTSAKSPALSPFSLRTTNSEVKAASNSETTTFTNKYLLLADKALHTTEKGKAHDSGAWRTARLRLEPQDGSPAKDYRIRDGEVEVRNLHPAIHLADRDWRRLTPVEIVAIAPHSMAFTPVGSFLGMTETSRRSCLAGMALPPAYIMRALGGAK